MKNNTAGTGTGVSVRSRNNSINSSLLFSALNNGNVKSKESNGKGKGNITLNKNGISTNENILKNSTISKEKINTNKKHDTNSNSYQINKTTKKNGESLLEVKNQNLQKTKPKNIAILPKFSIPVKLINPEININNSNLINKTTSKTMGTTTNASLSTSSINEISSSPLNLINQNMNSITNKTIITNSAISTPISTTTPTTITTTPTKKLNSSLSTQKSNKLSISPEKIYESIDDDDDDEEEEIDIVSDDGLDDFR